MRALADDAFFDSGQPVENDGARTASHIVYRLLEQAGTKGGGQGEQINAAEETRRRRHDVRIELVVDSQRVKDVVIRSGLLDGVVTYCGCMEIAPSFPLYGPCFGTYRYRHKPWYFSAA